MKRSEQASNRSKLRKQTERETGKKKETSLFVAFSFLFLFLIIWYLPFYRPLFGRASVADILAMLMMRTMPWLLSMRLKMMGNEVEEEVE